MPSQRSPADYLAYALAAGLLALAFVQWRAASAFAENSESAVGKIVDVREAKRQLLDARGDAFATVEVMLSTGEIARGEIPTALARLDIDPETAVGQSVPVLVDPSRPDIIRYGTEPDPRGAYVLALLAIGALLAPWALRTSLNAAARTPGGG